LIDTYEEFILLMKMIHISNISHLKSMTVLSMYNIYYFVLKTCLKL